MRLLLITALTLGATAAAATQAELPPDELEEIRATRRELAEQIAETAAQVQEASNAQRHQRAGAFRRELDQLERIDWLQARLLAALQRADELAAERQAVQESLRDLARGESPIEPPYHLETLDRLRAVLESEQESEEALDAAIVATTAALRQAERLRNEAVSRLESARRDAEQADEAEGAEVHWALRLAELESRAAKDQARLRGLELGNQQASLEQLQLRRALLAQQLAWVRAHLELAPADIERPLVRIEREEFELRNELNTAKLELSAEERRLGNAETRLDKATAPDPVLVEEVAARRIAVQSLQHLVSLLSERLERLELARQTWRRRYDAHAGATDRAKLSAWQREVEASHAELDRQIRLVSARLAELHSTRQVLRAKVARVSTAGSSAASWLREQDRHLVRLIEAYESDLSSLEAAARLHRWHAAELSELVARPSILERLRDLSEAVAGFWRYRVTTIEEHPITLGKLIGAVLLFVLGFLASRFLSKMLGHRLLPRFGMHTGASAAMETLTFYLLLLFFGLFALRMVNVPLTVFTVLGGAVAIGVGFGSQNIVNNFISGLILLIEQPIKVDDLIEVDGTHGKIEQIGARSTRVRTFSNIHIIVPNSSFLEKNVVNWTLSDDLVRVEVKVGVAYGSPTREVERIIHKVLAEHREIETYPAPHVFFAEFGDNALAFDAVFWIRISTHVDRRRIQSDIRYRIDELFREAGVVIAFPQRDVHLDTLSPLEVVVREGRDD